MTMTRQELFNHTVTQIRGMKSRAGEIIDGRFSCRYRSPAGPCVIGSLIPDGVYTPTIEGLGASDIMNRYSNLLPIAPEDVNFANGLQYLHDTASNWTPEGFDETALATFAYHHSLTLEPCP